MTARLTEGTLVRPAPDVAWEVLPDGGLTVCHLPTGGFWELSSPAGVLWTRLTTGAALSDLMAILREGSERPHDQTFQAAAAFCEALVERDLIVSSG